MLRPAAQVDARVESYKEEKITEREREEDVQVMADAGDNERGNEEESRDSGTVRNAFAIKKSECGNEEVAKEARIVIWSAPDREFLPVVKREPGRDLKDIE
jgi:hypothetical protein